MVLFFIGGVDDSFVTFNVTEESFLLSNFFNCVSIIELVFSTKSGIKSKSLSSDDEWVTGNNFTPVGWMAINAIGLILTPAPDPPPKGNLEFSEDVDLESSSFDLFLSLLVGILNSLPPAAKPKFTL